MGRLLASALALSIAGCETTQSLTKEEKEALLEQRRQQELAFFDRILGAEESVYDHLQTLSAKAAEYRDRETYASIGAVFVNEQFYPEELQAAALENGIGSEVVVRYVVEGSPADRAGMRVGDRLVSVNGQKAPRGANAGIYALKRLKRKLRTEESNLIVVNRGGSELVFEVEAYRASVYGLIVVPYSNFDITVDGDAIWISMHEIERLENGEELAYLCAFALAQNVMRHSHMKGRNQFLGQIVDIAAALHGVNTGGLFGSMGQGAYRAGFLVEADLIALYLLASAEITIDRYPIFWEKRLTAMAKDGELNSQSSERLEYMRKTIEEIQTKIAAGEVVHPTEYLSGEIEKASDETD